MKPQEALTRVIEHREILHDEMLSLMRQIMEGAPAWLLQISQDQMPVHSFVLAPDFDLPS